MRTARTYFIGTSWGNQAVPQHFLALSRELVRRGHKAVIIVDGCRVDVEDFSANPTICTWPSRRPTKIADARFLWRLIERHRPDCLISNFGSTNVMTVVGWLGRAPVRVAWRRTLAAQTNLDSPAPAWKSALMRVRKTAVYKLATHVVTNSNSTTEDLHKFTFHCLNPAHVRTFHNAVKDPLTPALAQASPIPGRFVCAGRFEPSKGQDVVIRALSLLRNRMPGLTVCFLGEGTRRSACEQLASDLSVAPRCTFLGAVAHEEVFRSMRQSVATLVPSRSEAFGFVNIESFAVGVPVIASAVGGIPEIVEDSRSGFLVPPDDPAALADKMALIATDPSLATRMAHAARQRFVEKFEQTRVIGEQADWLEHIVNERKNGRC